ncbi:hypothetical protein [Psychroserpens sp.]|uniref:hypothetical protein n=1 Tax=Psychroserpens sp. TaxID=2020870 RepID=UPI002B27006B|nr:hypothetical protein [Psychroserpens sp.]
MKRITLALLMLFTITTVAQSNSINYKALIKDANNAVVANTQVTVQFQILQSVAQTNVYQETHTPTTDANGIIIINIGDGVVNSGVYANIDWSSDDHFLNTQINSGSGLTDMGTTGFNAVPYALSAKTAETATNVTGLETIDEGNGNGLVKVGRVAANYGNVGLDAVDLSFATFANTTRGATGDYSTAMGSNTTASGILSTAMGASTMASGKDSTAFGDTTTASGESSTAFGDNSTASGIYSFASGRQTIASDVSATALGQSTIASERYTTAMGRLTIASGRYATAMGRYTTAESYGQTSLGVHSVPTIPISATTYNAGDQLLVVGNGSTELNRSNALVILKNGTITAPSLDIAEITDDKALVTKEFADANYIDAAFSGDYNDLTNTPFTFNTTSNTGIESASNTASDTNAIAFGSGSTASGFISTAMGSSTTASGYNSVAMGRLSTASNLSATAIGHSTTASGYYSFASGRTTTAESYGQVSLGSYNVSTTPISTTTFNALDRLLVVGNGQLGSTSDALVILKNGTITAPSLDIVEITDAKALVTKEYADANYIDAVFSGNYNDLSNVPVLFNGDYNNLTNQPALFSESYNDLTDLPVLFTTADETDPKVTSASTNTVPKWDGTSLVDGSINDVDGDIAIGTATPDPSAQLDVSSTTKGFLPPRMSEVERNSIAAPVAAGLVVWCTDCGTDGELQVFNGTSWTNMVGDAAQIRPPVLGDTFQGGIVIYVLQSGDIGYEEGVPHGLIAATLDQSSSAGAPWGCANFLVLGADGAAIGNGEINTQDIIDDSCHMTDGIVSAAELCDAFSVVGADGITYDDWYLPSQAEATKMIQAQSFLSGFLINAYWTSTEVNSGNAYQRHVGDFGGAFGKQVGLGARAVRSY